MSYKITKRVIVLVKQIHLQLPIALYIDKWRYEAMHTQLCGMKMTRKRKYSTTTYRKDA